jgi:hypothetical protein
MEGSQKCKNELSLSEDLAMEVRNNIPTKELFILKQLSQNIRETVKKHNGTFLTAPELGERSYLIYISTMIIRCECIDNKMVAVDISDIPSFIKTLLNKTHN